MAPNPPGRPLGKPYPRRKLLKMSEEDAARLRALADRWECMENEAVRRAIREAAKREGVE